jgi:hypothetical protein
MLVQHLKVKSGITSKSGEELVMWLVVHPTVMQQSQIKPDPSPVGLIQNGVFNF